MAFPDRASKKISDHVPVLKDQGMDYVAAAGKAGDSLQHTRAAQVGASPWAVTFVDLGLKAMADGLYDVIIQGPNGDERCDYTTRTANGFSITGGANAEQMIILVMGRLAGQSLQTP